MERKANKLCHLGRKWEYYHPQSCQGSVKTGECDKENCMFTHLQGANFIRWSAQNCENDVEMSTSSNGNQNSFASGVRQAISSR